jgi:hypothetical protein
MSPGGDQVTTGILPFALRTSRAVKVQTVFSIFHVIHILLVEIIDKIHKLPTPWCDIRANPQKPVAYLPECRHR